jgi:hypothetical protein
MLRQKVKTNMKITLFTSTLLLAMLESTMIKLR